MKKQTLAFCLVVAVLAFALRPVHAATLNADTTLEDQVAPSDMADTTPQFTKIIDDLPLMPGLILTQGSDFLFTVPEAGRLAETEATGIVDVDQIYNFYRHSLPHLGWKMINGRTYQREQDILRIDAHAKGKQTIVHFSVKPAAQE